MLINPTSMSWKMCHSFSHSRFISNMMTIPLTIRQNLISFTTAMQKLNQKESIKINHRKFSWKCQQFFLSINFYLINFLPKFIVHIPLFVGLLDITVLCSVTCVPFRHVACSASSVQFTFLNTLITSICVLFLKTIWNCHFPRLHTEI